jgi:hypothetical protein
MFACSPVQQGDPPVKHLSLSIAETRAKIAECSKKIEDLLSMLAKNQEVPLPNKCPKVERKTYRCVHCGKESKNQRNIGVGHVWCFSENEFGQFIRETRESFFQRFPDVRITHPVSAPKNSSQIRFPKVIRSA